MTSTTETNMNRSHKTAKNVTMRGLTPSTRYHAEPLDE